MMKKFVCLILSVSTLLLAAPAFSVQAADGFEYPYIYEDYEATKDGSQIGSGYADIVSPGVGGNGYALHYKYKNDYNDVRYPIKSVGIEPGQRIRFSAWVKPSTDISGVTFYLAGEIKQEVEGIVLGAAQSLWEFKPSTGSLKANEWTYVTAEGVWNGMLRYRSQNYDWNPDYDMQGRIAVGDRKIGLEFCVDDFIVEPINPSNVKEQPYSLNYDFEDGVMPDTGKIEFSIPGNTAAEVNAESAQNGNGGMHITDSVGGSRIRFLLNRTISAGSKVTVKFWCKPISSARNVILISFRGENSWIKEDRQTLCIGVWKQYEFNFEWSEADAGKLVDYISITPGITTAYEVCMDDISFEIEPGESGDTYKYPYCDGLSLNGDRVATQNLTADYTYASDTGAEPAAALLRLKYEVDGNWVSYGTFTNDEIALPAELGGKNVRIELVLFDADYAMSTVYAEEFELLRDFWTEASVEPWSENGIVTGVADIQNNVPDAETKDIVVILALYNADGRMVAVNDSAYVKADGGYNGKTYLTVNSDKTDAVTARIFVWSGTGAADSGETVYADAVTCNRN